jgi:hypothetical protein
MEKRINYCVVVPEGCNLWVDKGSDEWYELSDFLRNTIKEKESGDREVDICSTELYREGSNLIFAFKAVPATAPTMSTFPHYHALIVQEYQIVKGE